ncbi:SEP domain-containing protein [Lyophyllum atratum]|nr:SEP domain-containing protein [Lyophyllum atratum]
MDDEDGANDASRGGRALEDVAEPLRSSWSPAVQTSRKGDYGDDDNIRKLNREPQFAGDERSEFSIGIQKSDSPSPISSGDTIRALLRNAEAGPPPQWPIATSSSGGSHTLGGQHAEKMQVGDPDAQPEDEVRMAVIRHMTFWQEGFTIEDGELMRYDDPVNSKVLAEVNAGGAPPSVFNVLPGQFVEVIVTKRIDEPYVAPTRGSTTEDNGEGCNLMPCIRALKRFVCG